ncbi:acetyl-CoA synthetase-like protein [Cadophora sp. DSE1049]|nr:acetyl-CoA synthetase-like protein [Cadophora sp. DSE1049]
MPVKSLYPDIDIPNVDLFTFLFERKDRPYADEKRLFQDSETNRAYTYASLKSTALEFGKGLRAILSWKKGEVLALYTPNSIDIPAIIWGTSWAGGVISPANPGSTVQELVAQLKDSGARALITQAPYLKAAMEACAQVGIASDEIILIGDERDPTNRIKHFTSIRNTTGAHRFRKAKINAAKDLAFLMYSSGTTGLPKGVMLSHRNIVANVLQIEHAINGNLSCSGELDGSGGDKLLACLPFFHIFGLTSVLHHTVRTGFVTVVMPQFEIKNWCRIVQTEHITFSYIVPPIMVLLATHPSAEGFDLSSLKMLNSGAAPLTRELIEAVYRRTRIPSKQGYGLTETSPSTHTQPWEEWDKSMGSVGKMLPNMEAKYVPVAAPDQEVTSTDASVEVPVGVPGELYLRGPNIFLGYWKQAELTRNCITEDGWFRTGDVGFQDENGDFYITDRVKELIKYKGFQVAPASLEGLLAASPLVNEAAVIGVWSKELETEVPRAYIVRKGGVGAKQEGDEKRIVDWVGERVASHMKLRGGVRFVDQIPKSSSGKILRRVIKEAAEKQELIDSREVAKAKL